MRLTEIEAEHRYTPAPDPALFSMHTHDWYEIFYFISGNAAYAVEGRLYPLRHGDLMLMSRSEAHRLIVRSPAPYERMTVSFSPEALGEADNEKSLLAMFHDRPLGCQNHYEAARFPDTRWAFYLEQICRYPEQSKRRMYLLPLLNELSESFPLLQAADGGIPDRAAEIAAYINSHLSEELSLEHISRQFYISRSQLNRLFQKSVGSTVWEYITVKRLLTARERLFAGEAPTAVADGCGFHDYTTFFRAYKRQFGVSPRQDKASK